MYFHASWQKRVFEIRRAVLFIFKKNEQPPPAGRHNKPTAKGDVTMRRLEILVEERRQDLIMEIAKAIMASDNKGCAHDSWLAEDIVDHFEKEGHRIALKDDLFSPPAGL
jgi:hypothetical protein